LSNVAEEHFEVHLASCADCRDELRSQRQLLCTLDAAFSVSAPVRLPVNFTSVVATHAESNLRGLREKSETWRVLQLSLALAFGGFALLGATSGALVFEPARNSLKIAGRVIELFWHTVAGIAEGLAILGRMIGRAAVVSPRGLGFVIALVFIVAISLLPGLIANYHRTQIIE
jgi:hypothetical protein